MVLCLRETRIMGVLRLERACQVRAPQVTSTIGSVVQL